MSFAPDDDDVFGGGASVWGDAPSSSASSSSLASIQPSQQVATDPLPTAISSHTLSQPQIPSHEPASSKGYSSFDPSSFSSGFGGAVSASLEDDGFGFSGQPEFLPPPIPTQKSDFTIPPLHHTEAASPYDRLPALDPLGPGIYDEDIRGGFADPAYGSPFGAPPIPAQSVPPRRAPTNSAAADHSLNATLLRAYHAAQQQKVAAAEDIIPNPLLGDLPAPIPPPAPKKYSPKPAPAALPHPVPSNPLQEATAPAAVPAGGSLADQVIQNATRTDPLAADSSPVVNRDSVLAPPSPASHDLDDPFFGAARANSHPEPVASSSPKPKLTKTPKNGAKFIDPLMALSQDDEEDSEEESGPAPGSVAANNSSDKELPSTEVCKWCFPIHRLT
ncbi:hypothetical protein DFJ73DRAFT_536436 [Zopfochytrium polystomum]|nr:hypothetical protein DFJ73DRAFT_536436 [Zopfochytrium polystomum]